MRPIALSSSVGIGDSLEILVLSVLHERSNVTSVILLSGMGALIFDKKYPHDDGQRNKSSGLD